MKLLLQPHYLLLAFVIFITTVHGLDFREQCELTLPTLTSYQTTIATLRYTVSRNTSITNNDLCFVLSNYIFTHGCWFSVKMYTDSINVSVCVSENNESTGFPFVMVYSNTSASSCSDVSCRTTSTYVPNLPRSCSSQPISGKAGDILYVLAGVYNGSNSDTETLWIQVEPIASKTTPNAGRLQNWMIALIECAPLALLLLIAVCVRCRKPSGTSRRKTYVPTELPMSISAYVPTPGAPGKSGPAGQVAPSTPAVVVVPEDPGDEIPWDTCADLDTDCCEVVEYRCHGGILALNSLWVFSSALFIVAIYQYHVRAFADELVLILVGLGAGLLILGAIILSISMCCCWRNTLDPKGCGFCGGRTIDQKQFLSREMRKRCCAPQVIFCSVNPAKCCRFGLPFRGLAVILLNIGIGALSILAIAFSLLILGMAASGNGGSCGSCGSCKCDCDCCDCCESSGNSRNDQQKKQQQPPV